MTADVLFPRLRVAIFVDGCFWHGCPDHLVHARTNAVYWDMKISSNRARDRATDRMLQDRGWTSVRVWEHEDTNVAALRIASLVRQQSLAATPGMTAAR
jgi:DNA mismatch endonuclease (patch repair protein)